MSGRVEQRVFELLGRPTESPYGNPIPGLDVLVADAEPAAAFRDGLETLFSAAKHEDSAFVVHRLGEPVQTDADLLSQLSDMGVRPGQTITVRRLGETVTVVSPSGELDLPEDISAHIFVSH